MRTNKIKSSEASSESSEESVSSDDDIEGLQQKSQSPYKGNRYLDGNKGKGERNDVGDTFKKKEKDESDDDKSKTG